MGPRRFSRAGIYDLIFGNVGGQVLNTAFHSKELAPLVDGNYVVVHINVGDAGKENHDLAAHLGVPIEKGIPGLAGSRPEREGRLRAEKRRIRIRRQDRHGGRSDAFLEKWRPSR